MQLGYIVVEMHVTNIKYGEFIINKLNLTKMIKDISIQSAIISFYAKCNEIEKAQNIFNNNITNSNLDKYDIVLLYSTIMDCYTKIGDNKKVIKYFDKLEIDKMPINTNIYSIVITSCSHVGNINKGKQIFKLIEKRNKNIIDGNIIVGIIDCLSRGNELNEAQYIYNKYDKMNIYYYKQKIDMLLAILSGCVVWNNEKKGELFILKIMILLISMHQHLY